MDQQNFDVDDLFNDDSYSDANSNTYPLIGLDSNLSSFNFQLPDLDDFPSPQEEKKVPQTMFQSIDCPTKKSPWHESDSGMSDSMSYDASASPLGLGPEDPLLMEMAGHDFLLSELIEDAPPANPSDFVDAFGSTSPILDVENVRSSYEPEANLEVADVLRPQESSNNQSFKDRPVRKCVAERKQSYTSVDVGLDLSDSDHEEEVKKTEKSNQSNSIQPTAQVHDLEFFSGPNFAPARSDIKILKVVKSTAGSGDATSDDILKALDDRSKKNALQAKINREKKKAYISGLETDIKKLKEENETLVSENKKMKSEMGHLEDEVDYLKSVLANASALSGLLKNLNNVKEVKLSAAIMGRKRSAGDDHNYNLVEGPAEKRARLVRENLKKAGVCLHVSEGEACLEFCAQCASMARRTHGSSLGKK